MPPQTQQPSPGAAPAAALGTAGAGEVAATTGIGVAPTLAAAITAKVSAEAAKKIAEGVILSMILFSRDRERESARFAYDALLTKYPHRPPEELRRALRRELEYERTFRDKMRGRLERDLPKALGLDTPEERKAALDVIFEREKRYTMMREDAMLARVMGRVDVVSLKDGSPEGAFWRLSPFVKQHTADCIALGNKFWPWSAIEEFHPPIHPGCACSLHSLDEAVGHGWMARDQVPEEADAVDRVQSIRRQFGHLEEALSIDRRIDGLPLEEVEFLRWPKGVAHGGEFRPKVGGDPGAMIHRLLRHRGETPMEMRERGRHRWAWVHGLYTRIPQADRWERRIGRVAYHSPAGSTNLYRDGRLINRPGEPVLPEEREHRPLKMTVGTLRPEQLEQVEKARTRRRKGPRLRAEHSGATASKGPPISKGDGPEAVMALRDAGFRLDDARTLGGSRAELAFHDPETDARLRVMWDGQKVGRVTWDHRPESMSRRTASQGPPRSWRDHVSDALAWADELAGRYDAPVQETGIAVDQTLGDHAGFHDFAGRVTFGVEAPEDIAAAARARRAKRELSELEKRGVWSTYWMTAHETGHAVNPISPEDWEDSANANLEEALTEEMAHVLAAERLRAQGQDDVLRWREENPEALPVQGTYRQERHALADLLDQAEVKKPEERLRLVESLKFRVDPGARLDVLANLLHAKHPERSLDSWRDHVELSMANRPAISDEEAHAVIPATPGTAHPSLGAKDRNGREIHMGDMIGVRHPDGGYSDTGSVGAVRGGWVEYLSQNYDLADDERDREAPLSSVEVFSSGQASPGTGDHGSFWDDIESAGHLPSDWVKNLFGHEPQKGKGKPGKHKKPKPPKPVFVGGDPDAPISDGPFPVYDRTRLELGKTAGGSNGARWAFDGRGKRWLLKQYRGDQDRIATELAANAIYRELGAKVPEAGILHVDGKPALAYPAVDGKVRQYVFQDHGPNEEVGKHFMTDALLANWDFAGMTDDNILWDADGHPFRVDQGGTMQFRAMGSPKPFGPVPTEVWTMLRKGQGRRAAKVTEDEMRDQAREIVKTLTPQKVDEIIDAAPFRDEKMRVDVRDALKARIGWMDRFAKGEEGLPQPLEGAEFADSLAERQRHFKLFPGEDTALRRVLDEPDVQEHLRSGAKAKDGSAKVNSTIKKLDPLMRELKSDEDGYVYVGFNAPEGADLGGLAGHKLRERAYMGATTDEKAARKHGAVLRLMVPAGSSVAHVPSLLPDETPGEPELLLPHGQQIRITGTRKVKGKLYVDGEIA